MREMKDAPNTCNGYFCKPPVYVVTLRVSMKMGKKLAMKEMKDEPDTCHGYFGEPPVQVVTLTLANEMR